MPRGCGVTSPVTKKNDVPRALFAAPKRTVRLQMDYKLDNWLDRRRSPRMPRATLGRRLTADLNGVELQIVDLSAAGLRLSCPPERFPALQAALADDCCQLCLRLPNQPVVTVRAQVRHSHTSPEEVTLGVEIDPREVESPAWAAYRMALQVPVMKIAL